MSVTRLTARLPTVFTPLSEPLTMSERCPYLEYRSEADDRSFDEPRAYCAIAETFVQPMRADICNDRYDLSHETDCEIYVRHEEGE